MALLRAADIVSGKVKEPSGLTIDQFRAAVGAEKLLPGKLCGHEGCKNALGPRVDGEHKKIGGTLVCEDCYYDSLGNELEKFSIGGRGIRRRE